MIRFKALKKLLRTCEYSQNGKTIGVGTKDGERKGSVRRRDLIFFDTHPGQFMILNEADLEMIVTVAHRNQEVSDMKFSPGEQIGAHVTSIDSSFAMSQTIAT